MECRILQLLLFISFNSLSISSSPSSLEIYLGYLSFTDQSDIYKSPLCCGPQEYNGGVMCTDRCQLVFSVSLLDKNGYEIGCQQHLATAVSVGEGYNDATFYDIDDVTRPVQFHVPVTTDQMQLLIRILLQTVGPEVNNGTEGNSLQNIDEIIHLTDVQHSSDFFHALTIKGSRRANAKLSLAVRFSCVGTGCFPECLERPWLEGCSSLHERKSSPKHNYIGNPLARCPDSTRMPLPVTSPSPSLHPSINATTTTAAQGYKSSQPLTPMTSPSTSLLENKTSFATTTAFFPSTVNYLTTSAAAPSQFTSSCVNATTIASEPVSTSSRPTIATTTTALSYFTSMADFSVDAPFSSVYLTTDTTFPTSHSTIQFSTSFITEPSSETSYSSPFVTVPAASIESSSSADTNYPLLSTVSLESSSSGTNVPLPSTVSTETTTGTFSNEHINTYVDTKQSYEQTKSTHALETSSTFLTDESSPSFGEMSQAKTLTPDLSQIITTKSTDVQKTMTPTLFPVPTLSSKVMPSPSSQRPTTEKSPDKTTQSPFLPQESNNDDSDAMAYWGIIVGSVLGGLALVGLIGYFIYRSRQTSLQKRQELYTVTPQMISTIEENGTSGRSDVPMTTALL